MLRGRSGKADREMLERLWTKKITMLCLNFGSVKGLFGVVTSVEI
jgi:hypothetical protein